MVRSHYFIGIFLLLFTLNIFGKEPVVIWPTVDISFAGDLRKLSKYMYFEREGVRKDLLEFMISGVRQVSSKSKSSISDIKNALFFFDEKYDEYWKDANNKVGRSLSELFLAEVSRLVTLHRIGDAKQFKFSYGKTLSSYVLDRSKLSLDKIKDRLESEIDYIMYGTYTVMSRDNLEVVFTLLNIQNGNSIQFYAVSSPTQVAKKLALEFFNYFQLNKISSWKSKRELHWIGSPNNPKFREGVAGFNTAKFLCKTQGGRLPYADEIIEAISLGPYIKGGIGLISNGRSYYALADKKSLDMKQRNNHLFYYSGTDAHVINNGRLHYTDGGAVITRPYVICVKGAITPEIAYQEELFERHRSKKISIREKMAIRFIISNLNSPTSLLIGGRSVGSFDSVDEALEIIR